VLRVSQTFIARTQVQCFSFKLLQK